MKLNRKRTEKYLRDFDFESLFIEELGWDLVDEVAVPLEVDEDEFEAEAIAHKRGFTIYQCWCEKIPTKKVQRSLDRQLREYSQSHLLIFCDQAQTEQVWMWVKKEGRKRKPIFHGHKRTQSTEGIIQKLEPLFFSIDEEDEATLVKAVEKVGKGFNIEQVTKQFFQDFEGLHQNFCLEIVGIENENDRRWYASVVLNRLMFVYFLQKRYFLDNENPDYLDDRLKDCQKQGEPFYSFLTDLFFEGFAKPEGDRAEKIRQRLGKICYLNGGLFLKHSIEQKYSQISISDKAFEDVLKLFSSYSWHLNDRPDAEKESNEINPDVLGYIFEKYINQKEFGAYYTRPEITEYLCDRTINKVIVDKVNKATGKDFKDIEALKSNLNNELCHLLLKKILPTLTLLDPACGSGAFLVAAMKTLIPIYQTIIGKVTLSNDGELKAWFEEMQQAHSSLDYYIKKRIITDNLYGVDIMEEATEIAKLRLFLSLVSSVDRVEDLEPLPNVDFNIMAGNSLIGLIRVDGNAFDSLGSSQTGGTGVDPTQLNLIGQTVIQGNLLNALAASEYQRILEDKNKSIDLYKKHSFLSDDSRSADERSQDQSVLALRNHIDKLNAESQGKLNQLLLDEFSTKLGIRFEEAQLNTKKTKKRLLNIGDIEALEPFHWGYHFDKVFERGGFDAIIANPPWEIFKPNAKEFFAKYSDEVRKKKMSIKEFKKIEKKLLENPEIAKAWCEYQSQFPYVSNYYRSSEDYPNQISRVNGRKQGTDINLYKLFLERCFQLLQGKGYCGIIIPSGIYTDLGSKQLREMLFSQSDIDNLYGLSNEKFIFEGVHHAFKFALLSFEKGKKTKDFNAVFRINPREAVRKEELNHFLKDDDLHLKISTDLVRKLSPDSLSVMEFKQPIDISIAEKMTHFPLLGEQIEGKWNLKLNREFDMTNHSYLFKTEPAAGCLPLYEGKMIHQFTHQFAEPRYWVDEKEGRQAIIGKKGTDSGQTLDYQNYRLVHRRISSGTNERTLIACILPEKTFCGDTAQPAKKRMDYRISLCITSFLNSLIVDYQIRQRVTNHCDMHFMYGLTIPRLQKGDQWFDEIVERAAKLICTTPEFDDLAAEVGLTPDPRLLEEVGDLNTSRYGVTDEAERGKLRAELDGIIAHLYGLTEKEFTHILSTFPIVAEETKQAALKAFQDLADDPEIVALIMSGENKTLEFKSTAFYDMKTEDFSCKKFRCHDILKAVAGFLNSYDGGTLLIGVEDDGNILGLEDYDYQDKSIKQKDNKQDAYGLYLENSLIFSELGKDISPFIDLSFHTIQGKTICCIKVKPSSHQVTFNYLDQAKNQKTNTFFIRSGRQTSKLTDPTEIANYCKARWQ
ncbi:Eco57I restriction-modification methylase domain-containing protein [[Limnothrix rosea] IAM M-220]|uniref:Eco57I restriction-modification methylase domain-containing protein n=1 Tax=[Limnothrix rosea] IAM M-220 TaxID=454133 RepID=UPI00095B7D67|nr:RNA-binding domain-containing protein [[Limnothrix rosea] IAM M-220]OKH17066.1 ATP-binding protein [[Limnothrix rosea] IAM M-220]